LLRGQSTATGSSYEDGAATRRAEQRARFDHGFLVTYVFNADGRGISSGFLTPAFGQGRRK
jgi:hypothetical protein